MSMDMALWCACIAAEAILVALLISRQIARLLPLFTVYLVWTIFSDLAMMLVHHQFRAYFLTVFLVEMPLDSLLQFGVIVELAWSVLRPFRDSLPRGALFIVAALVLLAAVAVWPIAGVSALQNVPSDYKLMFHLMQTFSILRIVFFLVLAGFSQLLAIGWRSRELQVATGLGFYSLISLGAALLHAQMPGLNRYHRIDQAVVVSYVCSLVYWGICFVQKEAPRQAFSPRMQSILLAVSGTARASRVAIQDVQKPSKQIP